MNMIIFEYSYSVPRPFIYHIIVFISVLTTFNNRSIATVKDESLYQLSVLCIILINFESRPQ